MQFLLYITYPPLPAKSVRANASAANKLVTHRSMQNIPDVMHYQVNRHCNVTQSSPLKPHSAYSYIASYVNKISCISASPLLQHMTGEIKFWEKFKKETGLYRKLQKSHFGSSSRRNPTSREAPIEVGLLT